MMQPRAQMSDWQECPFLETTSGARKFGVPQSTLGGVSWGAQEGWHPRARLQGQPCPPIQTSQSPPGSHPWQRPPGPTLAASPRSPIFTSMFLLRKKLPGSGRGIVHGADLHPPPDASAHSPRPQFPFPALTELQVSVHDVPLVQVVQAADQAPQVVAHLRLCQGLPRPQHVGQRLQAPSGPRLEGKGKLNLAEVVWLTMG